MRDVENGCQMNFEIAVSLSTHALIFQQCSKLTESSKNADWLCFASFLRTSGAKHSPPFFRHDRPEGQVQTFSDVVGQNFWFSKFHRVYIKLIAKMNSSYRLDRD